MRLEGVGRRYAWRGVWVLRGVGLEVPAGAMVRVEGPNGGGKTTLLRLVAGVDAPSAGRISGRPRRTAYVPERFPAALPVTAEEYLVHLGRVHGLPGRAAKLRAREWLERFGAGELAYTPMDDLSKGGSQKVAVAQALIAEPELLVLDEAWTGLDRQARDELDRVVEERGAQGTAVVFVDHDPGRLAQLPYDAYRVADGGLAPADRADEGPQVVVEAIGPDGAELPAGLPWRPVVKARGRGAIRLVIPAAHSDALLRALLDDSRSSWHIRSVQEAGEGRTP